MPASSVKLEYWCLFQGDLVNIVQDISIYNNIDHSLSNLHTLFDQEDKVVYCAEISNTHPLYNEQSFLPLKKALDKMDSQWYGIATKAYAILNWDRNNKYCGRCGQSLENQVKLNELVYERKCLHCQLYFYPRISPSIIVRIQKGPQILMARSPHFHPGVYGLIAGFVEAGESLEQAVHREVQEEVGIKITNLRYFDSQPWPFPDSLMVAYTADYLSGEIVVDKKEIESADWYQAHNLPGRPSTRISIATRLIEDFINECL